jgi:LysM repeat protein
MKKILFLLLSFSSIDLWAEKQDSIGVETKENIKFVQYLVNPGETIYHLSTTHKVSITQLMTDNPGLENGLKVGQVVLLRNYIRTEPLEKVSQFEIKPETHVVQKGDTYYSLSKKYGISVDELLELNGAGLKEGQVLTIKKDETTNPTPVVAAKPINPTSVTTPTPKPVVTPNPTPTTNPAPIAVMTPDKPVSNPPVATSPTPKPDPKPVVVETPKPAVVATPKVEELVNEEDIYEFDPNKLQVLIVPFDPHLYWSDADDEIMRGSGLKTKLEVRKTIRRRLNALLDPMGYENIHLLGGNFLDTLTDLNKIYTSVSYDYQSVILSDAYMKTLAEQEAEALKNGQKQSGEVATDNTVKNKFNTLKDKVTNQTVVEEPELDKNADKYYGVIVKDPKFFEYFNHKYSIDYYIFINQFEVITDYDHCLDRTTENYVRNFVVHFSIFDINGKQIAGNKYKQNYNSNSNNIDKITGDNLQKMADRILLELPLPK